jgi:type II secretory pathway component PulF
MNKIKTLQFTDVFDFEANENHLKAIKKIGVDALNSGQTVGQRMNYDFALRIAELYDQNPRNFLMINAISRLKKTYVNPHVIEGLETVVNLMMNGIGFTEALAYRPAVFSVELITAFKAGEKNGDYSTHLLNYIKYRELLGAMHEKFANRDYEGLKAALL